MINERVQGCIADTLTVEMSFIHQFHEELVASPCSP